MKIPRTLNTRLAVSHLLVSVVSITLMAFFAGRSIYQAAIAEAEHNLEGLAFAASNSMELPIQELRDGNVEPTFIRDTLRRMFEDSPDISFTVYWLDGSPVAYSGNISPPKGNLINAPEIWAAIDNELGRGVSIRRDLRGVQTLYMAVLVQREIEVIAILRLGMPLESTLAAARQSLFWLLLAAVVIALAVSLFGWMLANNISRPIQILTSAADRMGQGDLGVRVNPTGPQEMHLLAEAFNKMARRLQSNVNELRAFVANASHELRTPLTVVKLRAEALQDGAMEDKEVAERFMVEIETEVDRLVRMVNDLLDLSRMEAGMVSEQPTLLKLSSIAEDVYETFRIRADRANIDLKLNVKSNLPYVTGNEDQIRRVFYNFLDNAIKYTPGGGEVELIVQPGPTDNTLRIMVKDTGPGISAEHLPHVFERFYRIETPQARSNSVRGSGLGLAIAKSIVESHGGEIGASSNNGNGTTFWADLPSHWEEE
jgi:signal transduction histidine kinase